MIPRNISLFVAAAVVASLASFPAGALSRAEVKRTVVEEALNSRVPPSLALAVAKVESDFQVRALSVAGARGVMQIMPATARGEFGVGADELWDPRLNVQLGIGFLEQLIDRYGGRWDLALSHYNGGSVAGSGPAAKVLPATRAYVDSVLRWQRRYADQSQVWRLANNKDAKDGWTPARTRTMRPQATPVRPRVAETRRVFPRRQSIVRWTPATVRWTPASIRWTPGASAWRRPGLDDFTDSLERRRLAARRHLDDFAPTVRWTDG